jgi:hypothetical protein
MDPSLVAIFLAPEGREAFFYFLLPNCGLSSDLRKAPMNKRDGTMDTSETRFSNAIDQRIQFHRAEECMEVDFSSFHFDSIDTVHRFYDRIEAAIADSGETLWFFLVNYSRSHIAPKTWPTFALRGKRLNHAHSQGSVRFDATEETRAEIEARANSENFDANLFADRTAAIARIREMPSQRSVSASQPKPAMNLDALQTRARFHTDMLILEIDFSHFTFHQMSDVDAVFEFIEDQIRSTGHRWFLLFDYTGSQVAPEACARFSFRCRRLLRGAAHKCVHIGVENPFSEDIRVITKLEGFSPNFSRTHDAATTMLCNLVDTF